MKLRSFFSVLATVVLVLLLIGVGGAYWLFSQNPLSLLKGGVTTQPAAAMFVPKQAPVMVSLLVNPDRLEAFRQVVARPEARRRTRTELAQFKQSFLATLGLDYQQDVQPWLGEELTLAITTLDIDRDSANGRQPGYLLAIASQNPQSSREFLQLFWQKRAIAGTDLVFEQYKGVKLIYGNATPKAQSVSTTRPSTASLGSSTLTPTLASAVVGDRFVLFANHPKVLRDAINNVQAPDLNLSSARFYDQALQSLTQPRIGFTFVNLPRLATWLAEESSAPRQESETAGASSPVGPGQMLAIALELNRGGLLAETALLDPQGSTRTITPSLTQPVGALKYVPTRTPLVAAGTNLGQFWTQLSQQLQGYEGASQLVSQALTDLQKRWQIDLPQDVFQWAQGEYALALLPAPAPEPSGTQSGKGRAQSKSQNSKLKAAPPAPDWIFVTRRTSEVAQQGIEHLDAIAKQQGLSVGTLTLGNQTVSAWTRLTTGSSRKKQLSQTLEAKVQGVHTQVGDYEIFATSIAAMESALQAIATPLLNEVPFQQAIAPLQPSNQGYLYLDWANSQAILERQFPLLKVIELAGQPIFSHLRSLTVSSYGSEAGIQRGGVFIRLS